MADVAWIVELAVKPGKLAALQKLIKEMVASARNTEPGTVAFEWFIAEDGKTCHIYERYDSSAGVLVHVATFMAKFAPRLFQCVKTTRLTFYGKHSAKVRAVMGNQGTVFMPPLGGFSR